MSGKLIDDGVMQACRIRQLLDGPIDREWMKAANANLVALDPSEYSAFGNA
jgi:hypothetical protein